MRYKPTYYYFFAVALLAQILVLDNISISTYCFPLLYIACIIFMPVNTSSIKVLLTALAVSVICDFSMGLSGLNIIATLPIAFFRKHLLRTIAGYDYLVNCINVPSSKEMGILKFHKYITTLVCLHSILFFTFEWFSFDNILFFITRLIISSLSTLGLIYLLLYLFRNH